MDAIVCPECGQAVPYGRLTCPACGTLLAAVSGGARRGTLARTAVADQSSGGVDAAVDEDATLAAAAGPADAMPSSAVTLPAEPTLQQASIVMPIPESPPAPAPAVQPDGGEPAVAASAAESAAPEPDVAEPVPAEEGPAADAAEPEPAPEPAPVETEAPAAEAAPDADRAPVGEPAPVESDMPATAQPSPVEPPPAVARTPGSVPSILRDWNGAIPASYVPPEEREVTAATPEQLEAAAATPEQLEATAALAPIPEAPLPATADAPFEPTMLAPSVAFRAPAEAAAERAPDPVALPLPPGSSTPAYMPRGTARRAPVPDDEQPPYAAAAPQLSYAAAARQYGIAGTSTPAVPPVPPPAPNVPPTQAGGSARPSLLAGRTIESPERLEEWAVLVGAVLAAASFILPWVPSQNVLVGGSNGDSYFDRWGLGTASNVVLFIVVLVFLAVAALATQVPARLRFGVLPVGIGGALAGVGWIYLGLPLGFGFGVGLLIVGAVAMIVGGGLELRHAHDSSSVP